ncbi:hypothetical protein GCM10028803_49360 [Larkinella knui]|uniref:Uncharacterized protein n=1 Tax=Larkinella knui TaxID=2025310 RepID=A0A3P1CQH8_9BACT|nr:hypothetical protein [Larkinella knui]RRB15508.1 hypothetical protein EHT87_13360 [Larkinella knui]
MKKVSYEYTLVVMVALLFTLTGCRDLTVVDRPYQRLLINDFSGPLRTVLPPYDGTPNTLTLRISGTISQPVFFAVDQVAGDQKRYTVRRDTLLAGTYTNNRFSGDYYSNQLTELVITGTAGTTGNLTVEWYRH